MTESIGTVIPEKPKRRYVDTKTRFPGVYARHSLDCNLGIGLSRCNCKPSYWGKVWDAESGRSRKTKFRNSVGEARNARDDLLVQVRSGTVPVNIVGVGFVKATEEFIADCRLGVALNKQGKPYTKKAITNLESSLRRLPATLRRKSITAVKSGDFQNAVDGFRREELSGSRIRAIINAARSLYTWAVAREKALGNPAVDVRLPVSDSEERDRIATPGEFAVLLDVLEPQDALPWAIAGYGTARHQEIQVLEWPEVDFEHDVMLLAGNEDARKSEAARRIVPLVKPLRERLYAEWIRRGEPTTGKVCPPRARSRSGLLSLNALYKRIVKKAWEGLGFIPITLQDSRHTAATWLDHAGVSPKVASVFMGHKAPKRQPDAAPITLRRYTHILPGELERTRDQFDAFLAEREASEEGITSQRRLQPDLNPSASVRRSRSAG